MTSCVRLILFRILLLLFPAISCAQNESTAFPDEEYIAFAISSVDQNCQLLWRFESNVATQGAFGTAAASGGEYPYGELCPGQRFYYATATYKWTAGEAGLQDTFTLFLKVPPPEDQVIVPVSVKRAAVAIKSVDFTTERITLDLNGSARDTSGVLTFEFETVGGVKSSQSVTGVFPPANDVSVRFDRLKIPKGSYSKLTTKWQTLTYRFGEEPVQHTVVGTYTPTKPWNILGPTRFSQYNTPHESHCTGAPTVVWKVDSVDSCNFEQVPLKSDFLAQTLLNGTGRSESFGLVKPGVATSVKKRCKGKFPDGANESNSYVQVSSVTGSCNKILQANKTIAMNPYNPTFKCGNRFLLVSTSGDVNKGTRTNQDSCPGCTDDHIDNYTDVEHCTSHDVGDLGVFWTVQTN